jgi:CRISPR-associated protein Cas5/CasD subtype I-E
MQSWGTQSRFRHRDTTREPSKSGVLGLVACALGRPRGAALDDLFALTLTIRVDREGSMQRDYQTAGGGSRPDGSRYGVAKSSGKPGDPLPSERYYLADADFRVALTGPDPGWLNQLAEALEHPHWPLYLGRRAFVPDPGLCRGVRVGLDGLAALRQEPWFRRDDRERAELQAVSPVHSLAFRRDDRERTPAVLRYVIELARNQSGGEIRNDVTRSFAEREFELRRVQVITEPLSSDLIQSEEGHVSVSTEA